MTKKLTELKKRNLDLDRVKDLPPDFDYAAANVAGKKILKLLRQIRKITKEGIKRKKDENSGGI